MSTVKCPKCNATGFLGHYVHVSKGICFTCSGKGFLTIDKWPEDMPTKAFRLDETDDRKGNVIWISIYTDKVEVEYMSSSEEVSIERGREIYSEYLEKGWKLKRTNDYINKRHKYAGEDWKDS